MFLDNVVQVALVNDQGVKFVGVLNRTQLREDLRSLIFKYGSKPQGTWAMLAQVTRIPQPGPSLKEPGQWDQLFDKSSFDELSSVHTAFELMLSMVNSLQEFVGSVVYPDVAVSPIAVYREILPLEK